MSEQASVEKVYILDGGIARIEDGSIYSPGINVGVPMALNCNACLIRHRDQWIMWDTGTPDGLFAEPGGKIVAHGIRGIVVRPIASQFKEIGISPDEVNVIMFSHGHYDHVGNAALFRKAKWIVQRTERDAMFGPDPEQFGYLTELYATVSDLDVEVVDGDHDVFGDGVVRMIYTPGHTPGHNSLLLRLPKIGPVLHSGDVAHNRGNLNQLRVPSFNADQDASVESMKKVQGPLKSEGASIWVNHDTSQSATLPHAPAWIE